MAIPKLDPECLCDLVPQSAYGCVTNEERLVRVLTDRHYDGAKVKTSAFRLEDIISEGVSLVRLKMVDVVEFIAVAEDVRKAAKANDVCGALVQDAGAVRAITFDDGGRALCVFDDPVLNDPKLRDNPAHCMAVSPREIDKADAQEIRFHLLKLFAEAKYLNDLWDHHKQAA